MLHQLPVGTCVNVVYKGKHYNGWTIHKYEDMGFAFQARHLVTLESPMGDYRSLYSENVESFAQVEPVPSYTDLSDNGTLISYSDDGEFWALDDAIYEVSLYPLSDSGGPYKITRVPNAKPAWDKVEA